MSKWIRTIFVLSVTVTFISTRTQPQLPTWWKEVDHMHLEVSDDKKLQGSVHSKDDDNEIAIAEFSDPVRGEFLYIDSIAVDEHKGYYYVTGTDYSGAFLRIFQFTPEGVLRPLHNTPEIATGTRLQNITLSYDNQYLYGIDDSGDIIAYYITPQNTLQQIQTIDLPLPGRRVGSELQQIIATPFANHNFLIVLSFDDPMVAIEARYGRSERIHPRGSEMSFSRPGGARARSVIVYPIDAQGQLGNPHTFDYHTAVDPRLGIPLTRSTVDGSEIHINETPITVNNQELYEIIVVTLGQRRTITDTFHLDPATGQLTLFNTEQKATSQELDDPTNYPGYVTSQYPVEMQELPLPPNWRAQIGRYIMRALKKEEKSLLPAGGTLRDVEKIIAEFATGTPPARPAQRREPRTR